MQKYTVKILPKEQLLNVFEKTGYALSADGKEYRTDFYRSRERELTKSLHCSVLPYCGTLVTVSSFPSEVDAITGSYDQFIIDKPKEIAGQVLHIDWFGSGSPYFKERIYMCSPSGSGKLGFPMLFTLSELYRKIDALGEPEVFSMQDLYKLIFKHPLTALRRWLDKNSVLFSDSSDCSKYYLYFKKVSENETAAILMKNRWPHSILLEVVKFGSPDYTVMNRKEYEEYIKERKSE